MPSSSTTASFLPPSSSSPTPIGQQEPQPHPQQSRPSIAAADDSFSWPLVLLTVFATIGGFLFGYDTGVVSGVEVFLEHDKHMELSDGQMQQVISVTVGAAALGTACSGFPLQWYGRRPLIVIAGVLYVGGSLALASAPDVAMLVVGRLVLGLGIGLSSIAIPVYLSELSPAAFRGRVVACYTFSIVFGQLVACVVNIATDALLTGSAKWRVSLGVAAAPALVQLSGFLCFGLPESPRWLSSQGRDREAAAAVRFIRGGVRGSGGGSDKNGNGRGSSSSSSSSSSSAFDVGGDDERSRRVEALVESDLQQLRAMPSDDVGDVGALLQDVWRRPHLRRIFRLGCGLQLVQQLSGINTIMYYGGHILELCGFGRGNSVKLAAVLALAQGVGLTVSTPLFDRMGRRALILPSTLASGVCVGVVALAFALGVGSDDDDDDGGGGGGGGGSEKNSAGGLQFGKELALLGLLGYLVSFGCGLSPGPWVVNAEIYPLHVRGLGNSAATTTNWVANYVVSATFLSLIQSAGKGATFALFALVCFASWIWLRGSLPETSGLSLEAVEDLFRRPGDKEFLSLPQDSPGAGGIGGGGGGRGGGFAGPSPMPNAAEEDEEDEECDERGGGGGGSSSSGRHHHHHQNPLASAAGAGASSNGGLVGV